MKKSKSNEIVFTAEEARKIAVEARKARVQSSIETSTERAAEVLHSLLDSEDMPPVVRLQSAKDILDRGGFKPVDRVAVAVLQPITGMTFELDS